MKWTEKKRNAMIDWMKECERMNRRRNEMKWNEGKGNERNEWMNEWINQSVNQWVHEGVKEWINEQFNGANEWATSLLNTHSLRGKSSPTTSYRATSSQSHLPLSAFASLGLFCSFGHSRLAQPFYSAFGSCQLQSRVAGASHHQGFPAQSRGKAMRLGPLDCNPV